jgi:hypothetical protein
MSIKCIAIKTVLIIDYNLIDTILSVKFHITIENPSETSK